MRGVRALRAAVRALRAAVVPVCAAVGPACATFGPVCAAVAVATAMTSTVAVADPAYAPLDQPGPPLSVPAAKLAAALYCEPSVKDADVTPVLLNPATGVTVQQNYSWNWEPALTKLGIPWCTYDAPESTLGDIPTSGEYLTYAIRSVYALAGRKIDVMGHSQGGMSMRWALRFWPDTRSMVEDVIGFSGSNHGTTVLNSSLCQLEGCVPATWQQLASSNFIAALNSGAETFAGINYTEIWTHTDEVVQPNGDSAVASAALHTGAGTITDVPTQQLCPADLDEHLLVGTVDPVAYALAVDALTHGSAADVARTESENPGLCSRLYMPGVNPLDVATYLQLLSAAPGLAAVAVGPLGPLAAGAPLLRAEPALPCYVYATCTGAGAPSLSLKFPFRHVARPGSTVLHVQVDTMEGDASVGVPNVTVTVDGARATTNADGIAQLSAPLRPGRRYTVGATLRGTRSVAEPISVS